MQRNTPASKHVVETSCDLETGADETLYTFRSDKGSDKKGHIGALIKSSNNDEDDRIKYLDDDRVGFDDESTLTDDSSRLITPLNMNNKQSYGGVTDNSNHHQQQQDNVTVISMVAKPNLGGRRRFLHRRTLSNSRTIKSSSSNTATTNNVVLKEPPTILNNNGNGNNTNMQLVIHKNRKRRWQYMCLAASMMAFFISLLISITIVIFYVFRSPYVYIDQLSITKLPTTSSFRVGTDTPHAILGFNLNFIIFNMNIQDAQLTELCIEKISIKDITAQTSYDLISTQFDWNYENNGTSLTLRRLRDTSYVLPISIDFTQQALSPAVIKTISDLIFSSLQSNHSVKWIIKGTARIKVGNLIYRVIDIARNQQYFSST